MHFPNLVPLLIDRPLCHPTFGHFQFLPPPPPLCLSVSLSVCLSVCLSPTPHFVSFLLIQPPPPPLPNTPQWPAMRKIASTNHNLLLFLLLPLLSLSRSLSPPSPPPFSTLFYTPYSLPPPHPKTASHANKLLVLTPLVPCMHTHSLTACPRSDTT